MIDAVPMVEVWRGSIPESRHRGHAVICNAAGEVLAAWGDPEAVILPRSSCKMLQALPLVESGAAADLSSERLALLCASHRGAGIHVSRVGLWLADLGLSDADLRCGTQVPDDAPERHRLRAAGAAPCQMHNNCSGKHSGFLMLNRHLGGGTEYVEVDHPVQKAVRGAFEEMCGMTAPGWGVDGCSAPNFATTVHGLGHAMARMADPRGLGRARGAAAESLVAAMRRHPELISGEGGACTELMRAMGGAVAVKTGAEAVYTAILPERGLGVALKIEDGTTRGSECAIAALLVRLGVADPQHPDVMKRLNPALASRRGFPAGEIRPDARFYAGGASLGI